MACRLSLALLAFAFSSLSTIDASAQSSCSIGLEGHGALPTTASGTVGGSSAMERSYQISIEPLLHSRPPALVEAIEFTQLASRATPTKETHRVSFHISLLPAGFGDLVVGSDVAVALHLRGERTDNTLLGVARITAGTDPEGRVASGINAFAQRYLSGQPAGVLAFIELAARDPALVHIHVVERTGHLTGAGSICSDSFGVTADLAVRVYTVPRVAMPGG
jgi:hypothetical protein